MKLFALLPLAGIALSGCQTMPDMNDTSNPTLRFRVHYETPGLGTPNVETVTTTSVAPGRCLYVNSPFGIVANVADKGGVKSIVIAPTPYPVGAVKARTQQGDIVAIPSPAASTQTVNGTVFPNPGVIGNGVEIHLVYGADKVFDTVTLTSVYEFQGASTVRMRATARNWGQSTGVAEVYEFYLMKAVAGDPAKQAGKPCQIP